jgi:hypothetical protein
VKRCSGCHEIKAFTEFHKNRARRDGLQGYCKPCRAVIDRAEYERTRGQRTPQRAWERGRAAWFLSLKTGWPCTDCGRFFPPQVMQWDHLPGTQKLGDVSTFKGRSREEVLAEIAKCQLVCANCHAVRTFERAGWATSWSVSEKLVPYRVFSLERAIA